MQPRIHTPLSAADRATVSRWTRGMIAPLVLVVVAVSAHASFTQHVQANAQAKQGQEKKLSPACLQWHQAASTVVARLAESTSDLDLRQINDAVFRMRRARRNCETGWLTLACQDYYAVARNLPGRISMHEESVFTCRRSAETGSFTASP